MNWIRTVYGLSLVLLVSVTGKAQGNPDSLDAANAKMVSEDQSFLQKATISKDSVVWVIADMRKDHRIYGFDKAGLNARRIILFSIFTNDVENNPFQLAYGAYYETAGLKGRHLKFISREGNFLKTHLRENRTNRLLSIIYFERKWFEFD